MHVLGLRSFPYSVLPSSPTFVSLLLFVVVTRARTSSYEGTRGTSNKERILDYVQYSSLDLVLDLEEIRLESVHTRLT